MDERAGGETPKAKPSGKLAVVRTIITLAACCGVLVWAYKTAREGMRASTQWVKLIRSGDVDDRQIAARQLGDSGSEEIEVAVPSLIAAMHDPDEPVRAAAATALGVAGNTAIRAKVAGVDVKEVAQVLVGALDDDGPEVRMSAASALGDMAAGSKDQEFPADPASVASAMIKLLADPDRMVRKRGEIALFKVAAKGPLGPPAALVEGLNGWPLKESRATAAVVLAAFRADPGPTVQALIKSLADKEPEVRSNAAVALQRIGLDAAPALPALVATLGDPFVPAPPPSFGVMVAALGGRGGGGGGGGGGDVANGVEVPTDPSVQATHAIGRIVAAQVGKGSNPPVDLLEALTKMLQSARQDLRSAAEAALRRIGKGASAAIPALIQGLVDATPTPEAGFGPTAASALGDIAPGTDRAGEAILALTSALGAKEAGTRSAAVVALGKFGPTAAAALPRLRELGEGADGDLAATIKLASDRIEGKAPPDSPRRKGQGQRGRGGPAPN